MPTIYRVTYRDQATGEILWQREMTSAAYTTWRAREQAELEAALSRCLEPENRWCKTAEF